MYLNKFCILLMFTFSLSVRANNVRSIQKKSDGNLSVNSRDGYSSIVDVSVKENNDMTFSFNGGGSTSGSVTVTYQKNGDWLNLYVPTVNAITGTGSTFFESDETLPEWARPTIDRHFPVVIGRNNAASDISNQFIITLRSTGIIRIARNANNGTFTNSASGGLQAPVMAIYYLK